jgi:hypothetical protein
MKNQCNFKLTPNNEEVSPFETHVIGGGDANVLENTKNMSK